MFNKEGGETLAQVATEALDAPSLGTFQHSFEQPGRVEDAHGRGELH